jgi:hypothetical protein
MTRARVLLALLLALLLPLEALACPKHPRSQAAVRAFRRTHVCPTTGLMSSQPCPGYVVDHIVALACGGADSPDNMQYQTIAEGKVKDRVERLGCPPCARDQESR